MEKVTSHRRRPWRAYPLTTAYLVVVVTVLLILAVLEALDIVP